MITTPWVVRLCLASLANHDRAAEEAAASLGAGPLTVIWRVTLPAMRAGIVAAALFAFVISFENLELALFLTSPGVTTLPVAVLQYLEYHIDPLVSAVAVAQIVAVAARAAGARPFRPPRPGRAMTAARLTLDALSKQFGSQTAVDERQPGGAAGEMIVLLGPSGCGKTTTLRMIAGFVPPTAGDIRLDGASIIGAAAASARNGHRVPELRAVSAPDRGAQRRVRAGDAAHGQRRRSTRASPRCCAW